MGLTIEQMAATALRKIEQGTGPWWAVEEVTEKYSEQVRRQVRHLVLEQLPPEEKNDEAAG
jgi:hypothetical protein